MHGEEGVGRKRELYEPEGHGSSQEALGGFTFLQCVCQLAWLEVCAVLRSRGTAPQELEEKLADVRRALLCSLGKRLRVAADDVWE